GSTSVAGRQPDVGSSARVPARRVPPWRRRTLHRASLGWALLAEGGHGLAEVAAEGAEGLGAVLQLHGVAEALTDRPFAKPSPAEPLPCGRSAGEDGRPLLRPCGLDRARPSRAQPSGTT